MAQEKEYSDIVQEEAEKLKEALKKKKKREDEFEEVFCGLAGAVMAGPLFVLLIMFFSLVACTTDFSALMQ